MRVALGLVHYHGRRFDPAAAALRRALELDPNSVVARLYLAWSLLAQKNEKAAIETLEPVASSGHQQILATLAGAYTRAGDRQRAAAVRQQLLSKQPVSAAALVRLHALSGSQDELFKSLDLAITEHSDVITSLKVDPIFDGARPDPRFAALLKRLKLQS